MLLPQSREVPQMLLLLPSGKGSARSMSSVITEAIFKHAHSIGPQKLHLGVRALNLVGFAPTGWYAHVLFKLLGYLLLPGQQVQSA